MPVAHSVFRNYDIRGEYGTELSEDAVYRIARAYARFSGAKRVVVGSDTRVSSPALTRAAVDALMASGVEVHDVGMVATDAVYFATWHGRYDGGIMITASHMPGKYNGMKFLRIGKSGMLEPIGRGLGMEELEGLANSIAQDPMGEIGSCTAVDIWAEYVAFVRGFVDVATLRPLKVVMDAGNGMGGLVAQKVFKGLGLDIIPLFFEPDGDFPHHEPNPLIPENRKDIIAKVLKTGADLGIAWDADCDRCYFIDNNGNFINGDFITALLAIHFLSREKGANIVYDIRSYRVVRDTIARMEGIGHISRVGHTYIKSRMRETGAVFGGEISGHYYFAANSCMDNGFIPAMILLEIISKRNTSLSEIIAELGEYYVSGEINFKVGDREGVVEKIKEACAEGTFSMLDGISVSYDDWRCNVRPSANDPVLRLNVEANSARLLQEKLTELEAIIGGTRADG